MDKRINQLHKKLNAGLVNMTELTGNALEMADIATRDIMTDDEFSRYTAFQNKLINLTLKGDFKAVEQLKKEYLKENG